MIDRYGWSDLLGQAFSSHGARGCVPARVLVQQRGSWLIATEGGERLAHLSGRLRHEAQQGDYPVVGDWVAIDPHDAVIRALLPRRTAFIRKAAGKAQRPQVVAANIDLAIVVMAMTSDFNLRRLERYLTIAWQSGARPIVALTKSDLCSNVPDFAAQTEAVATGCPVFTLSAVYGSGLEVLTTELRPGQTSVLLGSSGAGKSTLVNALAGRELMETGVVSAHDGRGQHTTTHRELLLLPGGHMIVDTPGMRELGMIDADEGVGAAFEDIEALAGQCRFRDCSHAGEPGCAIAAALEDGRLESGRWHSFQKLRRELAHQDRKDDRLAREAERKKWIAITRHQRTRRRNADQW